MKLIWKRFYMTQFSLEASPQCNVTACCCTVWPSSKWSASPPVGKLENTTMVWAKVFQGEGSSVGRNFLFDSDQQSMMPSRAGTYFIFINLNLTCTHRCSAGLLTVHVGNKITCNVHLPELADTTPVSKKCWTVSRIGSEKLVSVMTVPKEGLNDWKLELTGSGFGMFLVD